MGVKLAELDAEIKKHRTFKSRRRRFLVCAGASSRRRTGTPARRTSPGAAAGFCRRFGRLYFYASPRARRRSQDLDEEPEIAALYPSVSGVLFVDPSSARVARARG